MDNNLIHHIEALIFISRDAISPGEIKDCLTEALEVKLSMKEVDRLLEELVEKYKSEFFAFELLKVNNGYKFVTKGAYYHTLGVFLKQSTKKKLSRAALESLAIIAYKQPVTKSELEKIRGVDCNYSIQKLLEKELVEISGRDNGPGRPLLYGTSEKFMNYFGLGDLSELPKTKDFKQANSEVGEHAPIEEETPSGEFKSEEE